MINDLIFIEKNRKSNETSGNYDICLKGSYGYGATIIMSNPAIYKLLGGFYKPNETCLNNFFVVAIDEDNDRLYFKTVNDKDVGYTLQYCNLSSKKIVITNEKLNEFCRKHRGKYALIWDDAYELYYIDTNEVIE